MLTLFFHDGPVHNYDDARRSDTQALRPLLLGDARTRRLSALQPVRGRLRLGCPPATTSIKRSRRPPKRSSLSELALLARVVWLRGVAGCTVSFGVYFSRLCSEPYIWKRVLIPSSTLRSITGAIASPWLGAPPSSHERTRSVTSSWYSIGGSTVSLPSVRLHDHRRAGQPRVGAERKALSALPRLARGRLPPGHCHLVPRRLQRERAHLRLAAAARVPHVEAHRRLRDVGLRRHCQLRQVEANQERVALVGAAHRVVPGRGTEAALRLEKSISASRTAVRPWSTWLRRSSGAGCSAGASAGVGACPPPLPGPDGPEVTDVGPAGRQKG